MKIDKRFRSITKALSWRTFATMTTFIISYFVTGRISFAISISVIEVFSKLILYYFHERVWQFIDLGQSIPIEEINQE
jgi:adenylylsulfate kinase